ncbi:hypothetical protein E3T37_15265 [Cryobacterium sp. TMT2-10]|uniref:hypothetical protein n=1 Tax=Cryobacterium sp. TMT2-10 TaxID=1259244 RepID=UPI00106B634B|nr:hypothetical protein [Cryobacterium sp. TMT2-10]TFD35411.1 hypothetical protein E3T37_15265 [Cryobacterium sp. TMT2-10]
MVPLRIPVLEIACDESGNEGENLFAAGSTVFAHASTSLSEAQAKTIMDRLRHDTGSSANELKSSTLLKPVNRDLMEWLLSADSGLVGAGIVHFSEKRYFLVGKIIDLLVEEVLHERGEEVYLDGRARRMALRLYRDGPAALRPHWDPLVESFNSMIRAKQRKGIKATAADFYANVDLARAARTDSAVSHILRLIHAARPEAEDFVSRAQLTAVHFLTLDPVLAAVSQAPRTWFERTGAHIRVVHDNAPSLTPSRIATIVSELNNPSMPEFPSVPLEGISCVDSLKSHRVQVADLLAGVGRRLAEEALASRPDPLLIQLRPFVDRDSIWGDDPSWTAIVGVPLP